MSTHLDATTVPTPVGPLSLLATDGELRAMGFTDPETLRKGLPYEATVTERTDLGELTRAVEKYLGGDVTALDDLPVRQPGGPFLQAAWTAMRDVPAGETVTYTQLAELAGRPDAVRAAAMACARNLVAPVVPCHRILRKGGGMGGYYWGLPVKQWLLDHERRHAA